MKPLPSHRIILPGFRIPHFINGKTQAQSVWLFRSLMRESGKIEVGVVREFWHSFICDSFKAYKWQTKVSEIAKLQEKAENLRVLIANANAGDHRALEKVLDFAYRNMFITESPLRAITRTSLQSKSLPGQIRGLTIPKASTLQEHLQGVGMFYEYVRFLQRVPFDPGFNKKKVQLKLELPGTFLGNPLPSCRERNIIKRHYSHILQNVNFPVHQKAIESINNQFKLCEKHYNLRSRFLARRLLFIAKDYYSMKEPDGDTMKTEDSSSWSVIVPDIFD